MGQFIDLTHQQFGRWTVLTRTENDAKKQACWVCQCACGKQRIVNAYGLRSGKSQSCGCYRYDQVRSVITTHGESRRTGSTAEYRIWSLMKGRCHNPRIPNWADYGGRGITVCERWFSYANFLADMGRRPTRYHSLDRINNEGPYAPENCRWATRREQSGNMRKNVFLTWNGKTQIIADWNRELGFAEGIITTRLRCGWSPERIFTTPVNNRSTHLLTWHDTTQSVAAWERALGVAQGTLWRRFKRGWSIEQTLTTPVRTPPKKERSL